MCLLQPDAPQGKVCASAQSEIKSHIPRATFLHYINDTVHKRMWHLNCSHFCSECFRSKVMRCGYVSQVIVFWKRRAAVSDDIGGEKRQTVLIFISLYGYGSGPKPREQGNQVLAISQGVGDVDVDVEFEPT